MRSLREKGEKDKAGSSNLPHKQPQRAKARIKIGPGEEPDTGPKTGRDPKAGPEPPKTTQTGKTTREGKHHTDIEDN